MSTAAPLALDDLAISFGGNHVLEHVTIEFGPGFNGLVGPNGAGKTTAFNAICGYVTPDHGTISHFGEPIVHPTPAKVSKLGIGRTFQSPRLVLEMSVLENVMLGRHNHVRGTHLAELFGLPSARRAESEARDRARALLARFGLEHRAGDAAHSVPLGSQKLVEICRALATDPSIVLLDEPAAGLGVDDVETMVVALEAEQVERSLCIVMIEHDLHLVQRLCPFVGVLHFGRIIAAGSPGDVVRDPTVIEAYLGAGFAAAN